ncbi:MAG: hypothetical protein CVU05_09065 [Bacteroidetes bacterium HGW-Bacteroidetes-21]|jgi:CheY-like chemotaxis protein|nr:MAG: hypothetical protein CVU05_09065 [Bacteroidetes bacterium HGW-Bacteroidetes-21]
MKTLIPKILVVDDEIYNFKLIHAILHNYQAEVIYAHSGFEAIEKCKENFDITLVIMDIKMKGMNGFEAAQKILEFRNNIPIIYQTAYAKDFLKDDLMISIGSGYLEKPIKKDMLISEIRKNIRLVIKEDKIQVSLERESNFSFKNMFFSLFS